jgi:hypothetical protein
MGGNMGMTRESVKRGKEIFSDEKRIAVCKLNKFINGDPVSLSQKFDYGIFFK